MGCFVGDGFTATGFFDGIFDNFAMAEGLFAAFVADED
jgi:hypothetical protein